MNVTIESSSELERTFHVRIDSETFERHVYSAIQNRAARINLKGFRPGKVPVQEVRRRFGKEIRRDVALSLLQEEVKQSILEHGFNPASMIYLESLNCDADADLEAMYTLYIYPNVEFNNLGRIQVERPKVEITENDVLKVVNRIRRDFAPRVPVKRKPQNGDVVKVFVTQYASGSTENSAGQLEDDEVLLSDEFVFEVGALESERLKFIDEAIRDMQIGEERRIAIDQDDYLWDIHDEQQSGQATEPVAVIVKLLEVTELDINTLDDDWIKKLTSSISSESELHSHIRSDMEGYAEVESMATLTDQVFLELQRLYRVPIPPNLMDEMVGRIRARKSHVGKASERQRHDRSHNQVHGDGDAHAHQSDDRHIEEPVERLIELEADELEKIETYLLRHVHANAFAFAERIKINTTHVQVEVEQRMASYVPFSRAYGSKLEKRLRQDLSQRIFYEHMERQVVQRILDKATVKDAPCSYEDLMSGKPRTSHTKLKWNEN